MKEAYTNSHETVRHTTIKETLEICIFKVTASSEDKALLLSLVAKYIPVYNISNEKKQQLLSEQSI